MGYLHILLFIILPVIPLLARGAASPESVDPSQVAAPVQVNRSLYIPAYVVNHKNDARWQWMEQLCELAGLKPIRWKSYNWVHGDIELPVNVFHNPQGSQPQNEVLTMSSPAYRAAAVTLSHISAWQAMATDAALPSDAWGVFMEDDCNITRGVPHQELANIIQMALHNAKVNQRTFVFLGICSPRCNTTKPSLRLHGDVGMWDLCTGKCAHAYAMTKALAATAWEQMRAHRYAEPCIAATPRYCHNHRNAKLTVGARMCCNGNAIGHWRPDASSPVDWGPDSWMRPYFMRHPAALVDKMQLPYAGIFFQDRRAFQTQVWKFDSKRARSDLRRDRTIM